MPREAGPLNPMRFSAGALLLLLLPGAAQGFWYFPPPPPPEEYGNLLIDRTSGTNKVKPATFSHWSHRRRYTCRVCHAELDFAMKVNASAITEAENRAGKYCGACHNGRIAFGHDEPNCEKCHNGDRGYGKERFAGLSALPSAASGNRVDWVAALQENLIAPARFLAVKPPPGLAFDRRLDLTADWNNVPPAVFPHKTHTAWLDCANCHPDLFNIEKKTTKHFEMKRNLAGEFCGACHMTVAFPMSDCRRCHPAIKELP